MSTLCIQDILEKNNQLVNDFLSYIEEVQGYSKRTVVSYTHDLQRLKNFAEKNKLDLSKMTFEEARHFSLDLYSQSLSPATINRILSAQRSFFHSLCEKGLMANDPFLRVSRAKQGRKIPTVLSEEEVESILNSPFEDYTSLMEVTMFNMFFSTGCRLSELIGLELDDIDLPNRKILVNGKGSKQRFVFITERCASFMMKYLPIRDNVLKQNKINTKIFLVNKKGKQLPLSSVHIIFDKYRIKLGITKKFSPHVFRHTFATELLDNNSDIRIVQSLLGHESIGTTQIYTHVTGKRLENVYKHAHPHSEINKKEN